jgi:hypothetical protein
MSIDTTNFTTADAARELGWSEESINEMLEKAGYQTWDGKRWSGDLWSIEVDLCCDCGRIKGGKATLGKVKENDE